MWDFLAKVSDWAKGSKLRTALVLGSALILASGFILYYILTTFYEADDRRIIVSSLISDFLGWGADWIQAYGLLAVFMIVLCFLSAGILTTILFWFLGKIYKRNKQIELLEAAYLKLRTDYQNLGDTYEKETHIKRILRVPIRTRFEVKGFMDIIKFIKPTDIQNLSHEEVYELYKKTKN